MADVPGRRASCWACRSTRRRCDSAVERCLAWCAAPRAPHTVITANAAHPLHDARATPSCATRAAAGRPRPRRRHVGGLGAPRPRGRRCRSASRACDLMARLLEAGAPLRLRVYFLGAREEVVAGPRRRVRGALPRARRRRLPRRLLQRRPTTTRSSRRSAPRGRTCSSSGCRARSRRPGASGTAARLDVPVIMGVGGSFDVLAGFVRRAPLLLPERRAWSGPGGC